MESRGTSLCGWLGVCRERLQKFFREVARSSESLKNQCLASPGTNPAMHPKYNSGGAMAGIRAVNAGAGLILAAAVWSATANAAVFNAIGAAGINNAGGSGGSGDHYHWDPSNPGPKSQINYSFDEEGRGVAEFNLTSLAAPVGSAQLSFRVSGFQDDFYSAQQFLGLVNVFGYAGNNSISLSDFQSGNIGDIGSFIAGALLIGDILVFDVTSLVNARLGASLGVLWDPVGDSPQETAMTFDNLMITTSERTVDSPGTIALMGLAAMGLVGRLGRRRQSASV